MIRLTFLNSMYGLEKKENVLFFEEKIFFYVKKMPEKMKEAGEDSSLEFVLKNVRNFQGIIFVNLREL